MMIKKDQPLAIFDLDGTIYKTELVSLFAVHSAISDNGLEAKSNDEIKSLFGFTTPELCKALFPSESDEIIFKLSECVRYYERSLISQKGELYGGISKLLQDLKDEGWLLAICTNGTQVYVDTILDGLKLRKEFDYICLRDGVNTKADHIRNLIMNTDGVCVMIGDKAVDINAAAVNAIPSIGVTWGYGTPEEISHATYHVKSASEIKEVLLRSVIYHSIMKDLKLAKGKTNNPIIATINGVDTSGKTQFSDGLNRFLLSYGMQTLCIHLDDFHNESEKRVMGQNEIQAYIENAFNISVLENKILRPFQQRSSLDVEMTLLDLKEDAYTLKKQFRADADAILLLEGTLLFREPIDTYFSYRIFLDISFDEVKKRAVLRDVPKFGIGILEKYDRKYIPIQMWYLEKKNPVARADMVIDNNNVGNPIIIKRMQSN